MEHIFWVMVGSKFLSNLLFLGQFTTTTHDNMLKPQSSRYTVIKRQVYTEPSTGMTSRSHLYKLKSFLFGNTDYLSKIHLANFRGNLAFLWMNMII